MKKFTMLMLACVIGMFSVNAIGCGPGKAKDARDNPKAAEDAVKKSKEKTESGGK